MLLPMSPYWGPRQGVLKICGRPCAHVLPGESKDLGIGKGKGLVNHSLVVSVLVYKSVRK